MGFTSLFLPHSVHIAVSGLVEVFVGNHLVFDSNKHFLHSGFAVPVLQKRELWGLKSAILLVNWRDVDLGVELHGHGDIRVLGTTNDWDEVNAVIEFCVGWANNGAVPVSERLIVSFIDISKACYLPSSSPYEHDESPVPFSPLSSSSNNLKVRGAIQKQNTNYDKLKH